MRRKSLFVFLLALVANHLNASDRLNVLFIAADDLRNDLGCYGHERVKTPNLDRLAKRGMIFERAYCQQAVCNPSRASMLTGLRIDTLRIWDLPTHFREKIPDATTLPQYFKQQGYFAQNIGKIFHNWRQEIQGDPISWSVPSVYHFNTHGKDTAQVVGELPLNLASDTKCECRDVPDEAYFDGRIATLTIEALRERKQSDQPFFLGVGFWKPHSPFNAPKRYWDLYQRDEIDLPKIPDWPIEAPRVAWHNGREIRGDEQRLLTDDAIREIRHGYLAGISYMDAQVGKVLDELDRLDLTAKTVIVFWSDHGYHLGEHTLWAKTSNFELDARVPLIIAAPGMQTGVKTAALAELLDLYPTLVDLCGLPKRIEIEGASLVPVLNDSTVSVKAVALTQHPRPAYYQGEPDSMGYSIRSDTHRYTEWRDWKTGQSIATELYDHRTDPDETRNLSGKTELHAIVASHSRLLQELKPFVKPK